MTASSLFSISWVDGRHPYAWSASRSDFHEEEPAAAVSKQKNKDTKQRSDFKSHLVDTGCVLGDRPDSSPGFTFFSLSLSARICEMGTCKHLLLRGHRVGDTGPPERNVQ